MEASPEYMERGGRLLLVRRRTPPSPGLGEALKAGLRRSCACSVQGAWAQLQALFPAICWLRQYRPREALAGDVMSGLVIGIILVPQAIAYSLLAGLQPIYSLYTSFFANLIYFLMGTSRHVSVGIFSLLSLMVGQVVDRELLLAGFDPAQDGPGPGANHSSLNSSAAALALGLQDCARDCYAIRVATALTLVAGVYQVRGCACAPTGSLSGWPRAVAPGPGMPHCLTWPQVLPGFLSQVGPWGPPAFLRPPRTRAPTSSQRPPQSLLSALLGGGWRAFRLLESPSVRLCCALWTWRVLQRLLGRLVWAPGRQAV